MATTNASNKSSIDDILKKLDSSLGTVRSTIDEHKSLCGQNDDVVCKSHDGEEIEDKENSSRAAPNIASTKPALFDLSEQKKEMDKLRTFSIQLRLMHKKGRPANQKAGTIDSFPNISGSRLNSCSMESSCLKTTTRSVDASAVTYRVSNCRYLTSTSTVGNSVSSEETAHEEVVKNALRMALASTKIQSVFKGSKVRRNMNEGKVKVAKAEKIANSWRCFVARRLLAIKKAEMSAATSIQACWRAHAALKKYRQVRCKVMKCQASIRMWLSLRRLSILSQEVSCSLQRYSNQLGVEPTAVDATLTQPLIKIQQQLNAFARLESKWGVLAITRCEFKTKEERILEDGTATKLSSWWRRVHYQAVYKKAIRDVIVCQSIVRRTLDTIKVVHLWNEYRSECAAILIQANCRSFLATNHYHRIKARIIVIQSAARMMLAAKRWKMLRNEILSAFARFQSQGEYTLTAKNVAVCQAVVQSCSAGKVKRRNSSESTLATITSTSEGFFFAQKQLSNNYKQRDFNIV
ncbi:hypothetical protein ACHAXN_005468 [Cyclotella atomus]